MHTTNGPEPVSALQGVTAEQLLAAQPLPAWICAGERHDGAGGEPRGG
jgi:hypothetical protein